MLPWHIAYNRPLQSCLPNLDDAINARGHGSDMNGIKRARNAYAGENNARAEDAGDASRARHCNNAPAARYTRVAAMYVRRAALARAAATGVATRGARDCYRQRAARSGI